MPKHNLFAFYRLDLIGAKQFYSSLFLTYNVEHQNTKI